MTALGTVTTARGGRFAVRRAVAADVPAILVLRCDDRIGALREVEPEEWAAVAFTAIDADPHQLLLVVTTRSPPARAQGRRHVRRARQPVGAARHRAAAVEREGGRPHPRPVRRDRCGGARGLPPTIEALAQGAASGLPLEQLLARNRRREADAEAFSAAYRRYSSPVSGLDGVRLAPFQVLMAEGRTFVDRPHAWYLDMVHRIAAADPDLVVSTDRIEVRTDDAVSRERDGGPT